MLRYFYNSCIFLSQITRVPEQVIRFGVIGCINTAFSYSLYALFIFIRLHYTLAVLFSTLIGIYFSFQTMGHFVFDNPNQKLLGKFVLVYGGCYFVNIGFLKLLLVLGVHNLYVAGFLSQGLTACVSFCLNKFVVFRRA